MKKNYAWVSNESEFCNEIVHLVPYYTISHHPSVPGAIRHHQLAPLPHHHEPSQAKQHYLAQHASSSLIQYTLHYPTLFCTNPRYLTPSCTTTNHRVCTYPNHHWPTALPCTSAHDSAPRCIAPYTPEHLALFCTVPHHPVQSCNALSYAIPHHSAPLHTIPWHMTWFADHPALFQTNQNCHVPYHSTILNHHGPPYTFLRYSIPIPHHSAQFWTIWHYIAPFRTI